MSASSAQSDPRWKFAVEDVLGMVRAGILCNDDRVELLEGDLFPMSPRDPQHAAAIRRVRAALSSAYVRGFVIDVQSPLHASNHSLPEPDVMVLRGAHSTFDHRHPGGDDCVLVVKVTLSSDARDRRRAGIYAASLVPVYWRLDLVNRTLAVHEQPDALASGYARVRSLDESAELSFQKASAVESRSPTSSRPRYSRRSGRASPTPWYWHARKQTLEGAAGHPDVW